MVDLIRNKYPELVVIPGLGEYQTTYDIRRDAYLKGYTGGQPDIQITNLHKTYNGFALELKRPDGKGILSKSQEIFLNRLKQQNYKVMVSDDYDEIAIQINNYTRDIRIMCEYCIKKCKKFKNLDTLATHMKYFHRNKNDLTLSK